MIRYILGLTLSIEVLCVIGRLVFGSIKKFYRKKKLVRIHHGYVGLGLVVLSFFYLNEYLVIIGWSLFLSDLVHHFIVLPLWVGKTEFP